MAQVFDTKRRALGKGLESLLPAVRAVAEPSAASAAGAAAGGMAGDGMAGDGMGGRPLEIPLDRIERNPRQTRSMFDTEKLEELARSVAVSGVVQPIVVKAIEGGKYQLITGERRWLASQRAGKATIPAVVREVTEVEALEMTIVENLLRADLNPMEQARAFERLGRDFGMTQDEVAARTGKDRVSVANFLRLLRLPKETQQNVEMGHLTFGHARALLALEEAEMIKAAAAKVRADSLSVRQAEAYVVELLNPTAKGSGRERRERVAEAVDPNVRDAEDRLRQRLGLRVRIEDRKGRGRVVIEYAGVEDFDAILEALG